MHAVSDNIVDCFGSERSNRGACADREHQVEGVWILHFDGDYCAIRLQLSLVHLRTNPCLMLQTDRQTDSRMDG